MSPDAPTHHQHAILYNLVERGKWWNADGLLGLRYPFSLEKGSHPRSCAVGAIFFFSFSSCFFTSFLLGPKGYFDYIFIARLLVSSLFGSEILALWLVSTDCVHDIHFCFLFFVLYVLLLMQYVYEQMLV